MFFTVHKYNKRKNEMEFHTFINETHIRSIKDSYYGDKNRVVCNGMAYVLIGTETNYSYGYIKEDDAFKLLETNKDAYRLLESQR